MKQAEKGKQGGQPLDDQPYYKAEIIRMMSEDAMSLRAICKNKGFPKVSTVIDWTTSDEEFGEQYVRARELRADAKFEELDDVSEEAIRAETAVQVQAYRLKSDNIKWQLARMSPKKYGDKMALTDGDGKPLQAAAPVFNVTVQGK